MDTNKASVIIKKYLLSFEYILKFVAFMRGYLSSLLRFDRKAYICQYGRVKVTKIKGHIALGDRTILWPNVKISCVGSDKKTANLIVGKHCTIGDRTEIHCGESIIIGNRVAISWDCILMDRDYHSIEGKDERTSAIMIGHNVLIGCRSIILKGVSIGDNSVIASGSVVTKNVPPFTMVAGNPAQVKKKIHRWYKE
jgi:carbonic anhydrase/acetyltransferase-like protein (isoleucine patch superfamily)